MNTNDLINLIKIIDSPKTGSPTKKEEHFFQIGQNYFIRTATMALLGKLEQVGDKELVMSNASWVADSGRFHLFLNGKMDDSCEIEKFKNDVIVGRGALIDCTIWGNELPAESR